MNESKPLPRGIGRHIQEHIALYRRDPARAHLWDTAVIGLSGVVPTLLLRTRGGRSGEHRYVVLQYFRLQDRYVVVGSKGGAAEHPAWYRNLMADPRCTIQVGTFVSPAVARTAEGEEYDALWAAVSAEQPEYKKYQSRTSRRIPVVMFELSPAADP